MSDAALHLAVRAWLGEGGEKPSPSVEHVISPATTLARARPWQRRLGITRVADITGLDTIGIPVATAYRPNARSLSVAQGKGASHDAARASAVMEAIETAHAEQPRLALRSASLASLTDDGERHVDPRHLPHRPRTTFPIDRATLWAQGASLLDGAPTWVPYDAVHLDLTDPLTVATAFLPISSNGLASGNTKTEAVVHALCELIERDATSRWERAPVDHRRRIDPDTVDDPTCRDLLDRFRTADVDVAIHDIRSDVGLPVLLAEITDHAPSPFRPLPPAAGVGCHLHPAAALRRALTEAAQTRLIDIAGARDDLTRTRSGGPAADLASLPVDARAFGSVPDLATTTVIGDVEQIVAAMARCGLEPVVVELTRDDVGIPVVRAVTAGLAGLPAMMTGRAA